MMNNEYGNLWEVVRKDLATDLAFGKTVTASNVRGGNNKFDASKSVDNNTDTYWATDDHITNASVTIDFGEPTRFNRVLLQEYIRLGQRIKEFNVEASIEGEWKEISKETTVGYKRILRLSPVVADKIRINDYRCEGLSHLKQHTNIQCTAFIIRAGNYPK